MPDDLKTGADESQAEKKTVSMDEFVKLQAQLESVTKTQSGYDKVLAKQKELLEAKEKEIADIKKQSETEKLTAEEQLKAEIAEINSKLTAAERKAAKEHLTNLVKDAANQLGVPYGLVDEYSGDVDGIADYVERKKKLFDEETNKKSNMILGGQGYKPKGGVQPEGEWNPDNHTHKENVEHYEKLYS